MYGSPPPQPRSAGNTGPDFELISVDRELRRSIEVLVIDDEHSLRESCASLLRTDGFTVSVCGRGDDALRLVRNKRFDIVLLDLYMSQVSGLDIMRATLEASPDTLIVVMTGNPSVESSVTALRAGAWDYLPKPFSAMHFEILMGRAAHAVVVARESTGKGGPEAEGPAQSFSEHVRIYGRSPQLRRVIELANRVAKTDASVFITGESGTGKEVIAQYIHMHSRRSTRELVPVNCAAIPEALLESEMFGHVEGAFTGAVREKEGLLEVANGGTLFLDELTELPLSTQAKLLRVLQDGVVRRVGSTKTDAVVNVRFIAATNRDPAKAIEEGRLRKDLHYRLRVVPIHIPPLRERTEDIPVLAEQFLKEFWAQHRDPGSPLPTLSRGAMDLLRRAPWLGNVRELRNVIEHLVVMAPAGGEIQPDDIVFVDEQGGSSPGNGALFGADIMGLDYHQARERVLARFELDYLTHIVQSSAGNISDAARMAGVDRTTLYRLMEKHGIGRTSLVSGGAPD
ncbi:MAG TPA: sigma-54 dependent transcriptional regulator [Longimicrobiales bacterium]|nr:sigma-54 dependent transcriptional regulator [Longimicrobiales bacterium]